MDFPVESPVRSCPSCGSQVQAGHCYCSACGRPFEEKRDGARLETSPGRRVDPVEKVGLFRRVLADIIDRWVPCPFFAYLFPPWLLVVIGYGLLSDGLMEGRSVGKRLLGLRTLCADSLEPCTYGRSFLRNLKWTLAQVAYTSLFLIPLALAHDFLELLFVAFDREGRRLGDRLGGTVVVSEEAFRRK